MRQLFIAMLILSSVVACTKSADEPDTVLVDLTIISTTTPATVMKGQDIVSDVRCSGPDLCYHFSKFEIMETAPRQFEIRARATFPNAKKGDVVCLQAVYYKDTTAKINAATAGQYLLKFLNNKQVFKTDTVQVN